MNSFSNAKTRDEKMQAIKSFKSYDDYCKNFSTQYKYANEGWTYRSNSNACELCRELDTGFSYYVLEPTKPHPNCNCEIKKIGKQQIAALKTGEVLQQKSK